MIVKKMIELLQTMDPNAEVKLHERFGELVLFVVALANNEDTVWLETESDNDLCSELEARFEYAAEIENNVNELDFYTDLIETGINVDMIRKYMGDETANHMQEFCEEHGLL